MQYFTCDICDMPLKEGDYYTISIVGTKQKNQIHTNEEYYNILDKIVKEIKDVCPACKTLMDEIFRLRKNNLCLLSEELLGIWRLKNE